MCKLCDPGNIAYLAIEETQFSRVICNRFPISDSGHFLVIPKDHKTKLSDLSDEEKTDLLSLMTSFVMKVEEHICPEGLNVQFNQGKAAGQSMEHFHIHVFCRQADDGISNFCKNGDRLEIDKEELDNFKNLLK